MRIDCYMAVVALVEPDPAILHAAAVGIGEILLCAVFAHAKPTLGAVAIATLALTILAARNMLVALAALAAVNPR